MRSNRTFMELKCRGAFQRRQRYESSNRTFMELKYIIISK